MHIYILEYIRWPGYDAYEEVAGLYSTREKAVSAIPYPTNWKIVSKKYETEKAEVSTDEAWFMYSIELDAPIDVTFPAWER